jgi:hypothetical protein
MNLIGPSYNLESRPASVQRTVNMVPVPLEAGNERTAFVFKDVPGLVNGIGDAGWEEAPATESNIVFKTQTALASNGGLSALGEFPWPETSADGDLGVLVVFAEPARTITASAGWTEIDTFVCTNGTGGGARCTTFIARARLADEGTTGTVTASASSPGIYSTRIIALR